MPADLETIADPRLILLAWSAGLSLAGAFVSFSGVVGRGFIWLVGATSLLIAIPGALFGGPGLAWAGAIALVVALIWAGNGPFAGLALLAAGLLFIFDASLLSSFLPSLSAAIAVGGVTGEMMLGHWYLVDPRLPRWALRALAMVAIGGLLLDGAVIGLVGSFPSGGGAVAYWVLLATSMILMVGVILSLIHI